MRTLIVCGGTPPTKKLLSSEIEAAGLVLGADSGGYALIGHGFTPDLVIGDLDSFKYTNHEGIHTKHIPDQETNDLEKALEYALEQDATEAIVLGALGKRFDHTLKNLSVLHRYQERFDRLIFRDDYGDTFLTRSPYIPNLPVGTVISFFQVDAPVGNFTSTGVQYPLEGGTIQIGVQDGTSNMITSADARITFGDGYLGVFSGTGDKMKHQKRD